MQIISLSSITDSDIEKVGSRAVNLAKVNRTKILIAPLSFVIPNLIYEEFLLQNRLGIEIHKILKDMEKTRESIEFTHLKIRHLFEQSKIPEEFLEELQDSYEALSAKDNLNAQSLLEDEKPIVNLIISPSYEIDSEALVGTYLNIFGFDNFLNAIKSCYLSLYSVEHLEYRLNKGIEHFTCGIIVEKFEESDATIEARSKGILGNYEIPMNIYFGLIDVNRTIPKDYFSISKETFGIAQEDIKLQDYQFLKNNISGTLIRRSLGKRGSEQKIINKHIFEISRIIERISALTQIHFKAIISMKGTNFKLFMIEKLENRKENEGAKITSEPFDAKPLTDLTNQEIKIIKEEILQELINAPIIDEKEFEEKKEIEENINDLKKIKENKIEANIEETTEPIAKEQTQNTLKTEITQSEIIKDKIPNENQNETSISSPIILETYTVNQEEAKEKTINKEKPIESNPIIDNKINVQEIEETKEKAEEITQKKINEISQEEIKEEPKIIILDTDEFILSPKDKKESNSKNFLQSLIDEPIFDDALELQKQNTLEGKTIEVQKITKPSKPANFAPKAFAEKEIQIDDNKIVASQINEELKSQANTALKTKSKVPDLDFYMNIIMDIEPSIDELILNTYQEKFQKEPPEILIALEELDNSFGFEQKEQIFKLKSLKEMLNRGEEINLELFLDITEQLRKII